MADSFGGLLEVIVKGPVDQLATISTHNVGVMSTTNHADFWVLNGTVGAALLVAQSITFAQAVRSMAVDMAIGPKPKSRLRRVVRMLFGRGRVAYFINGSAFLAEAGLVIDAAQSLAAETDAHTPSKELGTLIISISLLGVSALVPAFRSSLDVIVRSAHRTATVSATPDRGRHRPRPF